ncbi:MAG: tetratricopeptide repeat protein [Saprospiraceae bacterium]
MTIIFRKDAFLNQLFPELKGIDIENNVELEKVLRNISSYAGYTPQITIANDVIIIEISERVSKKINDQYGLIVQLAEKGNFEQAKKLIIPLLEEGSQNADLYRINGQILEQEGEYESAIDQLIEALRWNPSNAEALIMMGNIFANYRKDIETAQLYYNQVVAMAPNNYLALNNIASVLAKSGKLEAALAFFEKARTAQPNYPNTLYGIALTHYNLKDLYLAFDFASQAMKASLQWKEKNDVVTQSAQSLMMEAAQQIQAEIEAPELFSGLLKELEKKTGKKIDVIVDNGIPTAAKIEIAEYRGRDHHMVRYKEQAHGVAHLVMHELIHLELIQEARTLSENKLFTTNDRNRQTFWKTVALEKKKMLKGGLDNSRIDGFLTQLFEGINLQIYNAPIDLFIEQRLYNRYEKLRPIQFLSLLNLLKEAIAGANNETAKKISPKFVRDANITLSFTQLFQFQELFGVDLTRQIKEPILEKKAKTIYQEYLRMKEDKEPGEEYDLIEWWAEDVKLKPYFNLVDEEPSIPTAPAKGPSFKLLEELIEELENDPFELDTDRAFQDDEMKKFVEAQRNKGINMAVVMYMADAFQYFSDKRKEKVREVGFEIAHLGRFGINPEKKETYHLSSVPGDTFSGWKMLAYMYVSWSIFDPSMVKELQLDFTKEYKLAQTIASSK